MDIVKVSPRKHNRKTTATLMAILAALLFGFSAPVSKLLLVNIPPTFLAALLYLGAGVGMLMINLLRRIKTRSSLEAKLSKSDIPYVFGMIALDILAPILLLIGLKSTTSANASLLNNFEIVATTVIALAVFREAIGRRMWIAIILITFASMVLSIDTVAGISFSAGSILILLAAVSWGFENNFTRKLSLKDPMHVVVIKGFGAGTGALVLSIILQESSTDVIYIVSALVLGLFAYGMSIYFYVSAQRELGAARTSSYYALAPFIGVLISFLVFGIELRLNFFIALAIMIVGTYLAVSEKHRHSHVHEDLIHDHRHRHDDAHHTHLHPESVQGEHTHPHTHEPQTHTHEHTPDIHHPHSHTLK
jgi:drug/metabolite transporter (DMT)-like permease